MTKKDLEQYRALQREIIYLEKRIAALEKKDGQHVFDVVKGTSVCFPYLERRYIVQGVASHTEHIKVLSAVLKKRAECASQLLAEIEKFVSGIDDSETRLILSLRYVSGLRWEDVARQVSPYATADSVRKTAERYLDKEK
jgi:hypothetical protein